MTWLRQRIDGKKKSKRVLELEAPVPDARRIVSPTVFALFPFLRTVAHWATDEPIRLAVFQAAISRLAPPRLAPKLRCLATILHIRTAFRSKNICPEPA